MEATLILIDSDSELERARRLVGELWDSTDPADLARLEAQALLIEAYEEGKWPRRPPSIPDLIRHLMDQHGLKRADLVPLLGTPSRVSEVLRGKKGLSIAMVQRLRTRFRIPADLLLPSPRRSPTRRPAARPSAPPPDFQSFGLALGAPVLAAAGAHSFLLAMCSTIPRHLVSAVRRARPRGSVKSFV